MTRSHLRNAVGRVEVTGAGDDWLERATGASRSEKEGREDPAKTSWGILEDLENIS